MPIQETQICFLSGSVVLRESPIDMGVGRDFSGGMSSCLGCLISYMQLALYRRSDN